MEPSFHSSMMSLPVVRNVPSLPHLPYEVQFWCCHVWSIYKSGVTSHLKEHSGQEYLDTRGRIGSYLYGVQVKRRQNPIKLSGMLFKPGYHLVVWVVGKDFYLCDSFFCMFCMFRVIWVVSGYVVNAPASWQ